MPVCGICGEPTAGGKHYGGICCRGCKGFFRRSVRLKRKYECEFENNCEISGALRNCCRACRYQRCLSIGLNPKLVHSDRACDVTPWRGDATSESDMTAQYNVLSSDHNAAFNNQIVVYSKQPVGLVKPTQLISSPFYGTLGSLQLVPGFNDNDFNSIIDYYRKVDFLIDEYSEHDFNHIVAPRKVHNYDLNQSLETAFLLEPRKMSDRSKMLWSPQFWLTTETFKRMWCRVALLIVDWASHIPELRQLNTDDCLKMMIGRAVPSLWLLFAHRSAKIKGKRCILMSGGKRTNLSWAYVPLEPEELALYGSPGICGCLIDAGNLVWDEFLDPAYEMGMTEEEFAFLRVICFLNAVPQLTPEGREVVRTAQDKYIQALTKLIAFQSGGKWDFVTISKRVSALLCLLPPVERTSDIEDQHLTLASMFNVGEMEGELTYQFYIKRTMRGR